MNILDPNCSAIANIGQIQSLFVIHGVALGLEYSNLNVINFTSNITLPYEDKIHGCVHLKEMEMSFTQWPKKYLERSLI